MGGFKGGFKRNFIRNVSGVKKEKYPLISPKEHRLFKQICLDPDTWKKTQDEQIESVKEGLDVFSPLFGKFLGRADGAVKEAWTILSLDDNQTNERRRAIQRVQNMAP